MGRLFNGSSDWAYSALLGTGVAPNAGLTMCARIIIGTLPVGQYMYGLVEDATTTLYAEYLYTGATTGRIVHRERVAGANVNTTMTDGFGGTSLYSHMVVTFGTAVPHKVRMYFDSTTADASTPFDYSMSSAVLKRLILGAGYLASGAPVAFGSLTMCDVGIFTRVLNSTEIGNYITDLWTCGKIEQVAGTTTLKFWPKDLLQTDITALAPAGCDVNLTLVGTSVVADHGGLVYPTGGGGMPSARKNLSGGMFTMNGGING